MIILVKNQLIACPSEAVRHGGGHRTKNLQGEREKSKRREERKREERSKRGEKGRREEERQNNPFTPWNCQKMIKDMERERKSTGKTEEEAEKARENIATEKRFEM